MINPSMSKLMTDTDSVYALVVAVAKRSRDLARMNGEREITLTEKPVTEAIDEFAAGKLRVMLPRL